MTLTSDELVAEAFLRHLPSLAPAFSAFRNELLAGDDDENDLLMYDFSAQVLMPEAFRPLLSSEEEDRSKLAGLFQAVEELTELAVPEISNFIDVEIFESLMTDLSWYQRGWEYMGEISKASFASYFERTRASSNG
jgi:hypothetical protein